MIRRLTLAIAILAMAALALLPGVASAQAGSPPIVAGVVVERQPPQVLGETLPRTGSNVVPMAIGALALLLVGGVLVVGARRRRDDDDSSVRLA